MQIHSIGIDLGETIFHLVALGARLDRLDARTHRNIVVVAMANKLARIAWAVLSSGAEYQPTAIAL
jgi:hypothetical protein